MASRIRKKSLPYWTTEATEAFAVLKNLICFAPVLAHPDFTREFILEIDASFRGLGACLSQQVDDGKNDAIQWHSQVGPLEGQR
jgi:hypothetical protein